MPFALSAVVCTVCLYQAQPTRSIRVNVHCNIPNYFLADTRLPGRLLLLSPTHEVQVYPTHEPGGCRGSPSVICIARADAVQLAAPKTDRQARGPVREAFPQGHATTLSQPPPRVCVYVYLSTPNLCTRRGRAV
ncbi:hypothetical protein EI94DRAFT_974951 [Lactarius quietus]|nr:hypothetical protein EI94DRAFT_974951 [Lactarius quietus]